jgi:hypothetical protein
MPHAQGPRLTATVGLVLGAGCAGILSRRNSSTRARIVVKSSAARVRDIKPSSVRNSSSYAQLVAGGSAVAKEFERCGYLFEQHVCPDQVLAAALCR